jgi:FlaA1/EpsC-like NDP-sugar epimerase
LNIQKKTWVIINDLIMSVLAWQFSWWARFNFSFPFENWEVSIFTIPLVVILQIIVFRRFRLYRGVWRFASIPDLWNIFRASIIGALSITLICFILFRLEGIPRSILILYPFFLMFFLGAPRLGYRVWKDHTFSINAITGSKRVLIIGAGRAAEMIVREIIRGGDYIPVGLLDDNDQLKNSEMHGVKVLGSINRVEEICFEHEVEIIIISIPSANSQEMRAIVEKCEATELPIRTLPGIQDMVSVTETLPKLREVSIEDLLGREKIELDWNEVQKDIASKTVLVTGGGGSIGSELCFQISRLGPSKLVVFERSEFNLYKIEQALLDSPVPVEYVLGDLCDPDKVDYVLSCYSPEIIFHAAAYKHVPILERDAREGIRNNIIGTKNIADMASKYECERFILISTDKAVNPTNVLGATKRIAEQYIENINKTSNTRYVTVRFGNVLGSDGSVVPLFKEQINAGGPVTVTHPEVTRYFMTIREACQLILQASKMGSGGEIYVLDMGEPVKINYLAEQMIRLSGLIPNKDVNIEYSGLRPGEKMYEELFYGDEKREKTSHNKIFLAKHSVADPKDIDNKINQIISAIDEFDNDKLKMALKILVPFVEDTQNNIISFSHQKI